MIHCMNPNGIFINLGMNIGIKLTFDGVDSMKKNTMR